MVGTHHLAEIGLLHGPCHYPSTELRDGTSSWIVIDRHLDTSWLRGLATEVQLANYPHGARGLQYGYISRVMESNVKSPEAWGDSFESKWCIFQNQRVLQWSRLLCIRVNFNSSSLSGEVIVLMTSLQRLFDLWDVCSPLTPKKICWACKTMSTAREPHATMLPIRLASIAVCQAHKCQMTRWRRDVTKAKRKKCDRKCQNM